MKRRELLATITDLSNQANNPRITDERRKALLAEMLAYWRELDRSEAQEPEDEVEVRQERMNQAKTDILEGGAFRLAELQGNLKDLAKMDPASLQRTVLDAESEILRTPGGDLQSGPRANSILTQMSRTWRFFGNSQEYKIARTAMEKYATLEEPSRTDNYVAAEAVKRYVNKNLRAATSAVGMTRMACALAFLKQTMTTESFRIYTTNLNALRGVRRMPNVQPLTFDKTDPRCLEPDEIGPVKEVYSIIRDRFHDYAQNPDKDINPRDLALLTALRNLQGRSRDGENLVVEHEALQAEVEKVQKDRRFQDALANRGRDELIEMAWGGNIDTLEGYTKPLNAEQAARVENDRNRAQQERARVEEEENRRREADERQRQEAANREAEQRRLEEERIRREEELRRGQRPIQDLFEELTTEVKRLANPLESIFDELEGAHDYVELAARLVALGEVAHAQKQIGENKVDNPPVNLVQYQARVEELKNDPTVKDLADALTDSKMSKHIQGIIKESETKGAAEKDRNIYVVSKFSESARKYYAENNPEAKRQKEEAKRLEEAANKKTVAKVYASMKKSVDDVLAGRKDYQQIGRMIAITVALRELENQGGLNAEVQDKLFTERCLQLVKDPKIIAMGQNMTSPFQKTALLQNVINAEDKVKAFTDLVDGMYHQPQANKVQEEVKQEVKQEPKPEAPVVPGPQ